MSKEYIFITKIKTPFGEFEINKKITKENYKEVIKEIKKGIV